MIKARIRQVIRKYNDNKNSAKRLLKWTGIAAAIGILIVLMLPIILFLALIICILIFVSFLYTRRSRKNFGIFDLISSIMSSSFWKNINYYSVSQNNYFYYCVSCGTKHKEVTCPRCGSKFKKKAEA
jgi:rubrerythrin